MSQQAEAFDRRLENHMLPDDAVGNELRVFGPPGCGKTTYLTAHIDRTAQRFGPKAVLFMSHTRTAAHQLRGKTVLPDENVTTLHGVCYRALGKPRIAETITERWNKLYPGQRLASRYSEDGEPTGREYLGDQNLRDVNRLRAAMIPLDRWPSTLRPFWAAWSAWKKTHDVSDFTDLIVRCLREKAVAPNNPSVIICDEFQDFSPLQVALVRSWAKTAVYLLIAGDDDQSIYSYAGADPRTILQPALPPSQIRILDESKRIPAAVHRYVVRHWSSRIRVRQPKVFYPRREEGVVKCINTGGSKVEGLVSALETHIAAGRSTMLLGTARFALQRPMEELQRRGVPYGNPYRIDQHAWNPLGTRYAGSGRRVAALIAGRARRSDNSWWKGNEIKAWASWLSASCWSNPWLRAEALKLDSDSNPDFGWFSQHFTADTLNGLLQHFEHGDAALADWWSRHTIQEHAKDAAYAALVVKRNGAAAATAKPLLTIGTIHSVKGEQADVVYVLPDVTNRWMTDFLEFGEARDALLRLFYVACTRAKTELMLCEPWRRDSHIPLGVPV